MIITLLLKSKLEIVRIIVQVMVNVLVYSVNAQIWPLGKIFMICRNYCQYLVTSVYN